MSWWQSSFQTRRGQGGENPANFLHGLATADYSGREEWNNLRLAFRNYRNFEVSMNAATMVSLIEEMMDLKLQRLAESQMKPNPEVARILAEKRVTDQRRLEHIRSELARLLGG
jgi:hypothetical protein